MKLFTLKNGQKVPFDISDIPETPESVFDKNPYLREDSTFRQWRVTQIARFHKASLKALAEAEDIDHFIHLIAKAKVSVSDPSSWEFYLSCRGMEQPKRKPGRPKKQNHRIKRSDQMKTILDEKGITVSLEGKLLIDGKSEPYEKWIFQPNGRIKFIGDEEFNIEPYTLSTHKFISDYC